MGPQGWALVGALVAIGFQLAQTVVSGQGSLCVGSVGLELKQVRHGALQKEHHRCCHHCQAVGT